MVAGPYWHNRQIVPSLKLVKVEPSADAFTHSIPRFFVVLQRAAVVAKIIEAN
jgi:hypothetical protein